MLRHSAVHKHYAHDSDVHAVAFSPDGRRLVSAGADCAIKVFDVLLHTEVAVIRTDEDIHALLFNGLMCCCIMSNSVLCLCQASIVLQWHYVDLN